MSIKKLFEEKYNKILSKTALDNLGEKIESSQYITSYDIERDRFIPRVDFSVPSNFARYGLASKYYSGSIQRIYKDYPFDGSEREKINFYNSSSYLDLYIFKSKYPRTTGYVNFCPEGDFDFILSSSGEFGKPRVYEYITTMGGPNAGPDGGRVGANIYNVSSSRESNLKLDGEDGNTIEFWLKKGFSLSGSSQKEVIFDLWNGKTVSHAAGSEYGRFLVYLDKTAIYPTKPFKVTYVSGTVSACTDIDIGDLWYPRTNSNILSSPENFAANWNVVNTAIVLDAALSPDETVSNASSFTADAVNLAHSVWNNTTAPTAGSDYTYSAFFMKGNQRYVYFCLDLDGTTYGLWADLWLGFIKNTKNAASMNDYGIDDYGGGWFRVWFNMTIPAYLAAVVYVYSVVDPTNEASLPYLGDGASNEIYIWGVECVLTDDGNLLPLYRSSSYIFDNEWRQYSISVKNDSTDLILKFWYNGDYNDSETITAGAINEVTGALISNIGSLRTKSNTSDDALIGYGKLSGSLDEFRFWKKSRTGEEVGRNWFCQVGGGTNTDASNVDLGVYYKFNEGITTNDDFDSVVLDYSGRISHGTWTGYNSGSATGYRSTGSAIDETLENSEFRDPIMYSIHPDVVSLEEELELEGLEHDLTNNSALYNSIPRWIREEDEEDDKFNLRNLCQIIGSYFDDLHLQIQEIPLLREPRYVSGSLKPYPFTNRLLNSCGFNTTELFSDIDILSQYMNKDENQVFEEKLYNIKNIIYQNIYNNLVYIYKSKGTEKAFRNLFRCFGVDDEILKINLYGDNVIYEYNDSFNTVTEKKKYVDFNAYNRNVATVYQGLIDSDSNTRSYISSSLHNGYMSGSSFTLEAEVIFPKRPDVNSPLYYDNGFVSCSLFGAHTVNYMNPESLTWPSADGANFQVYAVREEHDSRRAYFFVTGTSGGYFPPITSSWYEDVYDNSKWNFALRVRPTGYPFARRASGSDNTYELELFGVNTISDTVLNQFCVTGCTPFWTGSTISSLPKRVYIGAHLQDFEGSVLQYSDVKISSVRYWLDYLTDEEIVAHSKDVTSYGVEHPNRTSYTLLTASYRDCLPKIKTLCLHWDFNNVTGSDTNGEFFVEDSSSGSLDPYYCYSWATSSVFGTITDRIHTGVGHNFPSNEENVVDNEFVVSAKQKIPESLNSDDMVKILTKDDEFYNRNSRPMKHFWMIEKSMYQTISEEMLKMFGTIVDFNNLVGENVNRYRQEYKDIEKLRQLFFQRVQNTPDIEKYLEFYKWFDSSLSYMVEQLIPISANMSSKIHNVIENHVLERNKYWNKFPSMEMKLEDPEEGIKGVNELKYDWKNGGAPISGLERENCLFWKTKALRTDLPLKTYFDIDTDRSLIHSASYGSFDRNLSTPVSMEIEKNNILKGGVNYRKNKKPDYINNIIKNFEGIGKNNLFVDVEEINNINTFLTKSECVDLDKLNVKYEYDVPVYDSSRWNDGSYVSSSEGSVILPFTIFSSSVISGYARSLQSRIGVKGVEINNLHQDVYGPSYEVPLQGVFTETHVGGLQYRHVPLSASDSVSGRPEGWKIIPSTEKIYIYGPTGYDSGLNGENQSYPRAVYYRDEKSKRPINIRNIRGIGGNYTASYDVVQTSGRMYNNRALVGSGTFGDLNSGVTSYILPFTGNVFQYSADPMAQVRRVQRGSHKHIFVERFSAPGESCTMGDSNGGIGLDLNSAEYSSYNCINYRNMNVRGFLNNSIINLSSSVVGLKARNLLSVESGSLQVNYTKHCGKFGSDSYHVVTSVSASNYNIPASFHKTPRNARQRMIFYGTIGNTLNVAMMTSSIRDNFFVQTPIPGEDLRYSWISASFDSGSSHINCFPFGYFSSSYDLPFLTSSHWGWNDVSSSFVGIYSASLSGTYPLDFNCKILNQNGPYQYPSWKQIRNFESNIVNYWRKNNIYSLPDVSPEIVKVKDDKRYIVKPFRSNTCKAIIEPPITSKYKPFLHTIVGSDGQDVTVKYSHGNNLSSFANTDLVNELEIGKEEIVQLYDNFVDRYTIPQSGFNPIKDMSSLIYRESVYPREKYTYLKSTRERINYTTERLWKNERTSRNNSYIQNSQGFTVPSSSIWPLDARNNYTTAVCITGGFGNEGELQNNYTPFYGNLVNDENLDPAFPGNTIWRVMRVNYIPDLTGAFSAYQTPAEPNRLSLRDFITCSGDPSVGFSNYIGVNQAPNANVFSISVWVNFTSSFSGTLAYANPDSRPDKQCVVSWDYKNGAAEDTARCFFLSAAEGVNIDWRHLGLVVQYSDGKMKEWKTTDAVIEQNTWNHIVVTFDDTEAALADKTVFYVNGSSVANNADYPIYALGAETVIDVGTMKLFSSSVSGSPYEGKISGFSLWDDVLSAAEVTEAYSNGYPTSLYKHSNFSNCFLWYGLGYGFGMLTGSNATFPQSNISAKRIEWTYDRTDASSSVLLVDRGYYDRQTTRNYSLFEPVFNLVHSSSTHSSLHGTGSLFTGSFSASYVTDHGLFGSSQKRVSKWSDNFKVGSIFARRTMEYVNYPPWPLRKYSNNWSDVHIHVTGSYIFAGDTKWTAPDERGKKPYFEDYTTHMNDVKYIGKDYGIISEYRISDYMEYYIDTEKGNFLADSDDFLRIETNTNDSIYVAYDSGVELVDISIPSSSAEGTFFEIYSNTDFMKYFETINNDHVNKADPYEISLTCRSLMKFIPYDGFYPMSRTLQLASLFSSSYANQVRSYINVEVDNIFTGSWRAFFTPFFAPGILYNSIKSGMAVDWPIYTENSAPRFIEDFKSGIGDMDIDQYYSGKYLAPQQQVFGDNYRSYYDITGNLVYNSGLIYNGRVSRGIFGRPNGAIYNKYRIKYDSDYKWEKDICLWKPVFNADGISIEGTTDGFQMDTVYGDMKDGGFFLGDSPTSNDMSASWNTVFIDNFSSRLPFECLITPENYLSKKIIWDMNPEHSASLRTDLSDYRTNQAAVWGGVEGSLTYKLAMHNFLAETPSFFLKDGKFTTFVSKPIPSEGIYISENEKDYYYGMDVYITNSQVKSYTDYYNRRRQSSYFSYSLMNHKITDDELNDIKGIHTVMYSRDSAFGPPWVFNDHLFTGSDRAVHYHYSYEPFTPSYFNGFGLARILFFPYKGSGNYTLDDIFSNVKVFYMRCPTNRIGIFGEHMYDNALSHMSLLTVDENARNKFKPQNAYFANPNYTSDNLFNVFKKATTNWMQLSSSVNLFGKVKVKKVIYEKGIVSDFEPVSFEDSETDTKSLWVIQPKWETPIFNFIDKTPTLPNSSYGTGSVSKGIWHQYGDRVGGETGIIMGISDLPEQKLISDVLSPYKERSENEYEEEIENGEVVLYFREKDMAVTDADSDSWKRIIITGPRGSIRESTHWAIGDTQVFPCVQRDSTLFGGTGSNGHWSDGDTTYETAKNLCDAINNTTGGFHHYTASVFTPAENPYSTTIYDSGKTDTITAVKIKLIDFDKGFPVLRDDTTEDHLDVDSVFEDGYEKGELYYKGVMTHYPNYRGSSGDNCNKIKISLYGGKGATKINQDSWTIEGADANGNKVYSNEVFFYNGKTKKYPIKSLSDLVGFDKVGKRMGTVADSKVVSEAVIAVPFIENNGEKKFFGINRNLIDIASGKRKKGPMDEEPGKSIYDMVNKMKRYVFPPRMDFLTYDHLQPIVMYIFEFNYEFSKEDLEDIWQNLPPDFSEKLERQTSTISHKLLKNEFFRGELDSSLRWMIFKVKQKGEWNYFSKTADTSDDSRFKFDFSIGTSDSSKDSVPKYSYNWPYDFFSMVELIKLDVMMDFRNKNKKD